MEKRPKKLLDQLRDAVRRKHYSIRTEGAYVDWARRYIWPTSGGSGHNPKTGFVLMARIALDSHTGCK